MRIEWKQPALDGALAVVGGALLGSITQLSDWLTKVPFLSTDVFGISLKAVLFGAVALIAVKNIIK
jgi:hypothetical protein